MSSKPFIHCCLYFVFQLFIISFSFAQDITPAKPDAYTTISSNYVRTWDVVKPTTDANTLTTTTAVKEARLTTQYLDGLGRPLQTVVKQGSLITDPNNLTSFTGAKDLVSPVVYDEFGREVRRYLPYASSSTTGGFKPDPFGEQASFYSGTTSPISGQGETFYYSKTEYEPSPLNRVLRTYAPGNGWVKSGAINSTADRGVKTAYYTNTDLDGVRIWKVTNAANMGEFGSYTASSTYAANTLYKTITMDEQDKQVIEFKDKEGRVILKKVQHIASPDNGSGSYHTNWMCTYYIYDDLGQLRAVLQPRGTELLRPGNIAWNTALVPRILEEQFFRYEYDERGRMIVKKVPGAAPVYLVYDYRDRLVLSQDGNLRTQNKWMYTEYENDFNRPVSTGLITDASTSFAQHRASAMNTANAHYPNLSAITGEEELSRTFYDHYTWSGNPFGDQLSNMAAPYLLTASDINYPYPQSPLKTDAVKGMVTGTKVKVLGTASDYLYTVNYYDDKGRLLQVKAQNITGGVDIVSNQYSFSGQLLLSVQQQQKAGTHALTTTVATLNTYDELGRVVKVEKKVNNASNWKLLSRMEYDAVGQLNIKRLGIQANGLHRTRLDYDHNIRGWLLGINRGYMSASDPTYSFFGLELCYNKGGYTGNGNLQYNGNIGMTIWRSQGDGVPRRYVYYYDNSNRLLSALFTQREGSSWTNSTVNFDFRIGEKIITSADYNSSYDMNGNIKLMQHWGLKLNGSTQIDKLAYSYESNGVSNKLQAVMDSTGTQDHKLGDFVDGNTGTTDYGYDASGNMTSDANKGIASISYNHLNLPQVVNMTGKGTITYSYDAAGSKLKKVTVDNTGSTPKTTTTLYLGGGVYENEVLQFVAHEEGRLRYQPAVGSTPENFQWDYFIKDHLGNVRSVITEELKTDPYEQLSFEDVDSTQQNQQWENRTGQSIRITESRISRPGTFGTATTNGSYAMLVRKSSGSIGATKLLKVMAGDRIHTKVDYFYNAANTNNGSADPVGSFVSSLIGSLSNTTTPSALLKGEGTTVTGQLQGNSAFTSFINAAPGTSGGNQAPKAYLCVLFFDELFQFDQSSSRVVPVAYAPGVKNTIDRTFSNAIAAGKNGYVYVYFSNESDELVYFDNFMLSHERGPLLEETHYYPFGLTMAGISSKAASFGGAENKYKFNGIEQNTDFDMNMYDAQYRNFDPQLGRFWQLDPKPSDSISLYAFAFNNPIRYTDPLGDTAILGINNGAALGLGHQVLIYQDKDQNWFVYSMGAAADENAADLVSGRSGTGEVLIKALTPENFKGLPEGPLTANQITAFLADNNLGNTKLSDPVVINTTQKQDEQITANATKSQADFASGKEKYNLYTNNSTQNTMKVLNTNTRLNLPTGTFPKSVHADVKETIRLRNMTPEQRQQYRQQWEKKIREEVRRMSPGKI